MDLINFLQIRAVIIYNLIARQEVFWLGLLPSS